MRRDFHLDGLHGLSGRDCKGRMTFDPDWLARLHALGRMQARYLWFLVISSLFYLGLSSGTLQATEGKVKAPIVNLELDVAPILAAGPAILSFLVLVVMGALRAYRRAGEHLGLGPSDQRGEATDTEPNFLDLAFYSTGSKRPILRHVEHIVLFKYPVFLSLVLVQAGYLWRYWTLSVLGVLGVLLWLIAWWQVALLWHQRLRGIWPKKF